MQRSKKYSEMSDEAIVDLYALGAKGEKKWYLEQELQIRGLAEKAAESRKEEVKKSGTPVTIGKIILLLMLVGLFGSRMLKRFF